MAPSLQCGPSVKRPSDSGEVPHSLSTLTHRTDVRLPTPRCQPHSRLPFFKSTRASAMCPVSSVGQSSVSLVSVRLLATGVLLSVVASAATTNPNIRAQPRLLSLSTSTSTSSNRFNFDPVRSSITTLPLPPMVPPSVPSRPKNSVLSNRSSNPYSTGDLLVAESSLSLFQQQQTQQQSTNSSSSTPFKCPEQFGYFSDTRDCTRYFVCVFGDALHETCTGGLYFSSELQTCDWPNNVVCSVSRDGSMKSLRKQHPYFRSTQSNVEQTGSKRTKPYGTKIDKEEQKREQETTTSTESSTFTESYDYSSNDLDNPEYDESIASFVDQNGEVYVDDGPGGLFSVMGRSAAISDHDRPIFQTTDINSINDKKPTKISSNGKDSKESQRLSKYNNYEQPQSQTQANQQPKQVEQRQSLPGPSYEVEKDRQPDNNHHQCSANNCTAHSQSRAQVEFDDEVEPQEPDKPVIELEGEEDEVELNGDEHLQPRMNIVKKQLKDEYEPNDQASVEGIERLNEIDSTEPDVESKIETESAPLTLAKVANGRDESNVTEEENKNKMPEIVTFVADTKSDDYLSKRDLWNFDLRNQPSTMSSSLSMFNERGRSLQSKPEARSLPILYGNSNLYNSIGQFTVLGTAGSTVAGTLGTSGNAYSKYRRSQISRPVSGNAGKSLSEDSIMSIFRGVNKYSEPRDSGNSVSSASVSKHQQAKPHQPNFMQSFTLPAFQSVYSPVQQSSSSSKQSHLIKPKSIQIKPQSSSGLDPTNATIITDKNSQIIFYSYRNQQLDSVPVHLSLGKSSQSVRPIKGSSNLLQSPSVRSNGKEIGSDIFTLASSVKELPNKKHHSKQGHNTMNIKPMPAIVLQLNGIVASFLGTSQNVTTGRHPSQNYETTTASLVRTTPAPSVTTTTTTAAIVPGRKFSSLYAIETDPSPNYVGKPTKLEPEANSPTATPRKENNQSGCEGNFNCRLPRCFCPGTTIPNGFKRSQVPQMILLTFDDAVNDINFPLYQEIFERTNVGGGNRRNPNGCPIRGTFFVSHEWTDYGKVQTLHARGHEIASHSITHSFGEKFSTDDWRREIVGQREILHRFGGIPRHEIRGMRAPFLQIGGDQQFQMLLDGNFSYDSSIAIFDNAPAYWPFTLDFSIQHDCMITPCPTRSYPGIWEIGLTMWQDLMGGGRCTMGSSCTPPPTEQAVYDLIMNNFKHHYETNRAPFGLFYHSGWFTTPHHKAGFLRFVDEVLRLGDVYFVTNWQLLQWMQNPRPLDHLHHFKPWQCAHHHHKTPGAESECRLPNICHVKFRNTKKNRSNGLWSSRYFKTCQKCPTEYPWINNVEQLLLGKDS